MSEEAMLKAYCKRLEGYFRDESKTFKLNQPCNVTVKDRQGRYSKIPMIGDEPFKPNSAYVGKKGDVILVFTFCDPSRYAFMEMKPAEAREYFDGFGSYLYGFEKLSEGNDLDNLKKMAKAAEEQAKTQAAASKYADNDLYMSWLNMELENEQN